jgi:hypothetical protein
MTTKYPDIELIEKLRLKYSGYGIKTMTQEEILDLVNHTNELALDRSKEISAQAETIKKFLEGIEKLESRIDCLLLWKMYEEGNTSRVHLEGIKKELSEIRELAT